MKQLIELSLLVLISKNKEKGGIISQWFVIISIHVVRALSNFSWMVNHLKMSKDVFVFSPSGSLATLKLVINLLEQLLI